METGEDQFAKQYNKIESSLKRNVIVRVKKEGYHQLFQPYSKSPCDEPIDLTQNNAKYGKREEVLRGGPGRIMSRSIEADPLQFMPSDSMYLNNMYCDKNTTETKQAEILKAAKSLFSKRTRTLYHWMYPDTPKQQIKMAVANSWENLGAEEKQFYISQVLVRFGFPQCNLMVNPQLGGIKELPPLPDTFDYNYSSRELQTAISSISDTSSGRQEPRRRQGRPPGSKNKKTMKCHLVTYKIAKDFQDDPELSNELEKFAISFDSFK